MHRIDRATVDGSRHGLSSHGLSPSHAFAQRLARGAPICEPVALVVAHADDETLWAGAAIPRLSRLTLVHLTDSAPVDSIDAVRLGFSSRGDYARARAAELDAALAVLGGLPHRLAYGVPDKQCIEYVEAIVERLVRDLPSVAAILMHPYEGGHPDHDTAALAVRIAARQIERGTGRAPALVEFACYHAHEGARCFGCFSPDPACPEQVRPLSAPDRARVERALAEHRTQADVIDGWCPRMERWRAAPTYEFASPPPPGTSLYDGFGWAMTSTRWRQRAQEALGA